MLTIIASHLYPILGEIVQHFKVGASADPDSGRDYSFVRTICNDTVVKLSRGYYDTRTCPPECLALEFVRKHTEVPVPGVRRVVVAEGSHYIVMEKIEGTPLHKVWRSLTPSQRFGVALTLRDYLLQIRRASEKYERRSCPGPMGPEPLECSGLEYIIMDRNWSPFDSAKQLIDHFNKLCRLPLQIGRAHV